MSVEQFEQSLRTYLRRQPFRPFVIRTDSGEQIVVDEPAVAFNAGGGGYIGPDGLVKFFECEHVLDIASLEAVK